MSSDEEQLVNNAPNGATTNQTNNNGVVQILDAASTESNNDDAATNHSERSTTGSPTPSIAQRRKNFFILEPAVFFVFFGMYLSGAVYQNQVLYQTCRAVFHYNETECQPLLGIERETPQAQRIETEVQPYVTRIFMARSLLESIIPAIVSLFIGPWSDKFGRRPIILTTFTGYFCSFLILATLSIIASKYLISPWLFLLSSVPSVLSGGTCALITGIYCYISDVAKEKARAARMVLNEASLLAGIMVGNVASGYIYAATNVFTVFSIAAVLLVFALIYAYVFVVESLRTDQIHTGSKLREFFRFDLVKDLISTCFERRPNFDRAIIWLSMVALSISIFVMEGDNNVTYLFVREKFYWTLKEYTFFSATRIVVQIVGSVFGLLVMRKIMKFSIVSMLMISIACCVLESTVRATAFYSWEMYLGLTLGMMRGMVGPMARALQSHVTPPTDVGKIYALTTSLECLTPLAAAPLYTLVYNATILVYPGAFNFISGGLFLIAYALIATIYGIQKSLGQGAYQAIGS